MKPKYWVIMGLRVSWANKIGNMLSKLRNVEESKKIYDIKKGTCILGFAIIIEFCEDLTITKQSNILREVIILPWYSILPEAIRSPLL